MTPPRTPLVPLNQELRELIQRRYGMRPTDAEGMPLGLTDEEKKAAANPGLPDPNWRRTMETKPGWKTSEYWLTLIVTLVVLPVLGYLGNEALSPLAPMLTALASASPVLAIIVPVAKTALFGFLAWCAKKLAVAFNDGRVEVKLSANSAGKPAA